MRILKLLVKKIYLSFSIMYSKNWTKTVSRSWNNYVVSQCNWSEGSNGDVTLGQELCNRLADTDVAHLGDDFTYAALCAMGFNGVISVLSNPAPRLLSNGMKLLKMEYPQASRLKNPLVTSSRDSIFTNQSTAL